MITVIVPSFDRASQLDCFLRSMQKHWGISELSIHILYKYSNEEFKAGYDLLRFMYRASPHVSFWQEQNFGEDFKALIRNDDSFTMLATDDCVFFKPVTITEERLREYFKTKDLHCYSLRLGENTIIQDYVTCSLQSELFNNHAFENEVCWNFKRHNQYSNYGYAFSLDMSIYHSEQLHYSIAPLNFESPRALEHQLNVDKELRSFIKSWMMSPVSSVGFVNTINCVQPNGPPAGTRHSYSVADLNKKFLAGRRISLSSFDHLIIMSCHEEVPLTFQDF